MLITSMQSKQQLQLEHVSFTGLRQSANQQLILALNH